MRLLSEVGLLTPLLPEVAAAGEESTHTLRILEFLPVDASFPLALAALLDDVGRDLAGRVCRRLKLSNSERDRIVWLVEMNESLCDARRMRNSSLKPVLAQDGIRDLLALHRANAEAAGLGVEHVEFCEQKLTEWRPDEIDPPALLTGDDLLVLGIKQGPVYKRLLEAIRVEQLDGTVKTKGEAIAFVEQLLTKSASGVDSPKA